MTLRFLLVEGGPTARLLARWRASNLGYARNVFILGLVLWLPLVCATALDGTLFLARGGFAEDWGVHVHLLIGLPLLLLAEPIVGARLKEACAELSRVGLVDAENAEFANSAARRAEQLRDSRLAEVLLLAAALGLTWLELNLPHRRWIAAQEGAGLSLGGYILALTGAPLHRFVGLRWFWRLAIWAVFLRGLARSDLRLLPAHPDRAGGLGELANAHLPFALVIFAFGLDLAGGLTTHRLLYGTSVTHHQSTIFTFALLMPVPFLAPLFSFSGPLVRARRRWRIDYAMAAADYVRRFQARWLAPAKEPLGLESAATSTHIDMVSSFEVTAATRVAPFGRRHYAALFFAALLPLVGFYVQEVPLLEILKRLSALAG